MAKFVEAFNGLLEGLQVLLLLKENLVDSNSLAERKVRFLSVKENNRLLFPEEGFGKKGASKSC